jgi:hypothetical protein
MAQRYFFALWIVANALWLALFAFVIPWPTWGLVAVPLAWLTADAGSYVFHVALDHHLDPYFYSMARGFREHHTWPTGIAHEPVMETMVSVVPAVMPVWLLFAGIAAAGWMPPSLALYLFVLGFAVGWGQMFHRWSHSVDNCAPVRWAQRLGLFISPAAHKAHHAPPFTQSYAIISGWTNRLFDAINLDAHLSRWLTRMGFPRIP